MTNSLFLLALSAILSPARASSPVEIEDQRCVTSPPASVHESITDYDRYSKNPGATYSADLLVQKVNLLTMTKSQAKHYERSASRSNSLVYVELQPTNLQDASVYPRFFLSCYSGAKDGAIEHGCRMLAPAEYASFGLNEKAPAPYGLTRFDSSLRIRPGKAAGCGKEGSKLEYRLTLQGNDAHVDAIKAKVLAPAGALRKPLEALFDEDRFFRAYFQNFYDDWASRR